MNSREDHGDAIRQMFDKARTRDEFLMLLSSVIAAIPPEDLETLSVLIQAKQRSKEPTRTK